MAGFSWMFNFDKPGHGIDKDAPQKRGFFLFFEIYFRKFWRVISLSLSYTLLSAPVFLIYFFLTTYLQGLFSLIKDPAFVTYMGIYLTLFLVSFLGAGPVSAGHAYVLRNFSREDHAWVWDDMCSQVKANFRQGLALFILDIVLLVILTAAACLYLMHGSAMPLPPLVTTVFGFLAVIMLAVYFMMHFFLYPLMVTFDMKLGAILKTALQLTMGHLPQCVFMFLLSIGVFALFLALYFLNVAFVILFAALGFSTVTFVYVFYGTSVIDRVLAKQNRK